MHQHPEKKENEDRLTPTSDPLQQEEDDRSHHGYQSLGCQIGLPQTTTGNRREGDMNENGELFCDFCATSGLLTG